MRERFARAAADTTLKANTARATQRFVVGRAHAAATLDDFEGLRESARAMKAAVLDRLPELLDQFASNAERYGTHVHWALDADEANRIVVGIAKNAGARTAVKGKSMVTEEIDLNAALEAAGCTPIETDLGEWIIQLADETPSHIIAPAMHKNRQQVATLFNERRHELGQSGEELPGDPGQLAAYARRELREAFLSADIGISGCNFAVAETGSIVLVSNEGNGRLCTSVPRVHVAVMGCERIVESWDQLDVMINLLARSATGQQLSTYTNIITGPRRAGDADGPDELHIVIVDNGRSDLLHTEYQEILACIRCGSCLNHCPVYRQTGGHAYGWAYSGPMGAVLTPLLRQHEEGAAELAGASSLCAACMDACPVGIPIQDLLLALRRRNAASAGVSERSAWSAWSHTWSRPAAYRASQVAATRGRAMAKWAPGAGRWTAARTPIVPARRTFTEQWKAGEG